MKSSVITYDSKSLIIKGRRQILLGGEIHYFRIPHTLWRDRLLKMKNAGCDFVSVYIPWNYHEPQKGKENWDKEYSIKNFLDLCKKLGLYVIIKPGPFINAEWDCGGYPHWVLYSIEESKVRRLNKEYLDLVKYWYKKVIKIIKPYFITNAGNIILLQIENEYDHLMELSGIYIPDDEAYEYLLEHYKIVKELGVDIPIITNEAKLIRGKTEIIDTRTYYPDIPWLWKWNFQYFDKKIEDAQKQQPDKPLFIMELQAGWFTQFDFPEYDIPKQLIVNILKNVLSQGASLLNIFLFTGGTTFPYWGCRGDIYGPQIPGHGSTTSYDFMAPIREWGEINEKKYYDIRAIGLFIKSFPQLIYDTQIVNNQDVRFLKCTENIKVISKDRVYDDTNFETFNKKVLLLQRSNQKEGFLFLRNLDDEEKNVVVSYISPSTNKKSYLPIKGELKLPAYSCFILPIDVYIPYTETKIVYSTSELLTYKKLADNVILVLYGLKGEKGEVLLEGKFKKYEVIVGEIKKDFVDEKLYLSYTHNGLKIAKLDNLVIIILDDSLAGRVYLDKNCLVISDVYFLRNITSEEKSINLEVETKISKNSLFYIFSEKPVKKIFVDAKQKKFKLNKKISFAEFCLEEKKENVKLTQWITNWKYKYDGEEKEVNYNDKDWQKIEEPVALEKLKIFDHGYIWYRAKFELPKLENAKIILDTNGIDRATFYLNGKFVWKGIGKTEIKIDEYLNKENILAICYENAFHTKGHPAEGPIVKYSGLQKPVMIKGKTQDGKEFVYEIKNFKIKVSFDSMRKGFYLENFDDKDWKEIEQAEYYVFKDTNYLWLRRRFKYEIKDGYVAPLCLKIKKLTQNCLIYLNGKLIGKYEDVGPQKKFYLPENLLKKENLLVLFIEGSGKENIMFSELEIQPYYVAKERKITINL